jgi:hypothetical protein
LGFWLRSADHNSVKRLESARLGICGAANIAGDTVGYANSLTALQQPGWMNGN